MNLYPPHDPRDLEPHYSRNVEAMTAEGLHEKSDIAAQLAARDARIAAVQERLAMLDHVYSSPGNALYNQQHYEGILHARRIVEAALGLLPQAERVGEEAVDHTDCSTCGGSGEVSVPEDDGDAAGTVYGCDECGGEGKESTG